MSFNVTQCPACESTFNTNSRVLAAAAGKVRCGACLNVFEAIDNFVNAESEDASSDVDDSVFVGNEPGEYFDPSRFLTRSALRDSMNDAAQAHEVVDEQDLHEELERTEKLNEDFFATVAEELHGREASAEKVENSAPIHETTEIEPAEREVSARAHENTMHNEIIESFDEVADDGEELDPTAYAREELAPTDFNQDQPQQPLEAEEQPTVAEDTEAAADLEEAESVARDESVGFGLSASYSFSPYRAPDQTSEEEPDSDEVVTENDFTPEEADSIENVEATSEEEHFLSTVAEELEQESVEAPSISARDQLSDENPIDPEPSEETASIFNQDEAVEDMPSPNSSPNSEENESAIHSVESQETLEDLDDSGEASHPEEHVEEPAELDNDPEPQVEAQAEKDEESTEAIRARALQAELDDEEALEAIPKENLAALGTMSTPVELLGRRESRWLRSSLLFLCVILFSGLLSAQFLWQNRMLYSQLPQLRNLYETACNTLSCELPEFSSIDAIRSENLTVQSHPTFDNGLMVTTIIRNTAAFEQTFPILILSFNSAENSVIALREFTADEYLDPGLRSIELMPSMTPVQISLAIMDPGPAAVNYTLAFRLP